MAKTLYERVKDEQALDSTMKWIEKHDRLYKDEDLNDKLKMENQLAFWRKNCDIRNAFNLIESEVKMVSNPSVRLVGWSEIARKAKCDRNTLKKIERIEWVKELREKILNKINIQNQNTVPLTIIMSEQEKIQHLEKQLTLLKAEAARWFVKYEEKVRELHLMKEGLERQMNIRS